MIAYVLTTHTWSRQTVRGTMRRWTSVCVHNWTDRIWEGAHFTDGKRAWDYCAAINLKLKEAPHASR